MFIMHDQMNEFFRTHVRLGKDRRSELATFRDNSITRMKSGLDKLGEAYPTTVKNQGGYAMHTLNQADNNDYDIDTALIFEEKDLPKNAKKARERIRDAFLETGGQFKETPTARKNAVTVWYASGQHLDFAIYRKSEDAYGNPVIQHASDEEWTDRDPDALTTWFDNTVTTASPSSALGAKVEDKQLRKIVRFVKYFAKSRKSWSMPGGMILSALVAECYRHNTNYDDVSLLHTLDAINTRLEYNTQVLSPIDSSDLTEKEKRQQEMENFKKELKNLLGKLEIIKDPDCTQKQAYSAWKQFFNHDFWAVEEKASNTASLLKTATAAPATSLTFPAEAMVPKKPQGFA